MHNGFYNEQLFGYKYSDYNLGHGYAWEDLKGDYKRNVVYKSYWNDQYFISDRIGPLTKANAYDLKRKSHCAWRYSNPWWNMTIVWN